MSGPFENSIHMVSKVAQQCGGCGAHRVMVVEKRDAQALRVA